MLLISSKIRKIRSKRRTFWKCQKNLNGQRTEVRFFFVKVIFFKKLNYRNLEIRDLRGNSLRADLFSTLYDLFCFFLRKHFFCTVFFVDLGQHIMTDGWTADGSQILFCKSNLFQKIELPKPGNSSSPWKIIACRPFFISLRPF